MIRLDKYLTECGVGTRSDVKKIIRQGRIKVNNTPVKGAYFKVNPELDIVLLDEKEIEYEQYSYYIFHKPAGCITANSDSSHQTIMEYLPSEVSRKCSAVGRLDKDTEGLLLITNDGELGHKLLSPKKHVDKEYYVECLDKLTEEAVKAFKSGMELKDGTVFAKAECTHIEDYSCHLVLHEGKYHEIKRMFLSVGNEVTYLKRIRMKNLILDETLKKGEYRLLTDEELNDLKKDEQE